jgi:hypothetical protein
MENNAVPVDQNQPDNQQQGEQHEEKQQHQQDDGNIPLDLLRQLVEVVRPSNNSIKVPEPSKFTPDSTQHAGAFIRTMETYFELTSNGDVNRYTDNKKIGTVLLQTGGLAQVWAQTFIDSNPNTTWNDFKAAFLQRFVPANQSSDSLKFLQEHIRVLSRPDLKQAIDQYTEVFLQKKQLIQGVNDQTFALLYQQHLPRTLHGYVENKVREWQANHVVEVANNEGQPSLVDIIAFTNQAIPLCQSMWSTTERRAATKKDSFSRTAAVNAVPNVGDTAETQVSGSRDVVAANAVSTFNGNRNGTSGMRGGNRFKGSVRRNNMPPWVMSYCREHHLCFRCKEAFPGNHTPGQPCNRAPKQLDDKLKPQSN